MRGCEGEDVSIVLAAGRGLRMGGPKALMMVGGRVWWRVQRERLRAAGVRDLWVVSREVMDSILRERDAPDRLVVNNSEAPMITSVIAGVVALHGRQPRGVFVLPVDVPVPSAAVWTALSAVDGVSVPRFGGRRGHPLWLPWSFVARVILPRVGDKEWEMRARLDLLVADEVAEVDVHDAGILANLNTPRDVERWEKDCGYPGLGGSAARPGDGAGAARPD